MKLYVGRPLSTQHPICGPTLPFLLDLHQVKHCRPVWIFRFQTSIVRVHIFNEQLLCLGLRTEDPLKQFSQIARKHWVGVLKWWSPLLMKMKNNLQSLNEARLLCQQLLQIGRYLHAPFHSANSVVLVAAHLRLGLCSSATTLGKASVCLKIHCLVKE